MSIRLASYTSVTTTPSGTGSLQIVPYVFPNPISICSILGDRRGRRWIFCPRSGRRTLPHQMIKTLKSAKEIGELETEGENATKPLFGRIFESQFDLPNHCSNNIIVTDSDFILTERTCAIPMTADVIFKTALAADFKREYNNIEFLWKQRPGEGGMIAFHPVASQIPGNYLCFLVKKAFDRQHVCPESFVLALT